MENEKYLFVVSGAAGTGKDSVVKALREAHPEIEKTVSATTRAPRPGEQEGVVGMLFEVGEARDVAGDGAANLLRGALAAGRSAC